MVLLLANYAEDMYIFAKLKRLTSKPILLNNKDFIDFLAYAICKKLVFDPLMFTDILVQILMRHEIENLFR